MPRDEQRPARLGPYRGDDQRMAPAQWLQPTPADLPHRPAGMRVPAGLCPLRNPGRQAVRRSALDADDFENDARRGHR